MTIQSRHLADDRDRLAVVLLPASEEVADWTGRYGWTRQQWWQNPPSYVRFTGWVMLIVATIVPYRR